MIALEPGQYHAVTFRFSDVFLLPEVVSTFAFNSSIPGVGSINELLINESTNYKIGQDSKPFEMLTMLLLYSTTREAIVGPVIGGIYIAIYFITRLSALRTGL